MANPCEPAERLPYCFIPGLWHLGMVFQVFAGSMISPAAEQPKAHKGESNKDV